MSQVCWILTGPENQNLLCNVILRLMGTFKNVSKILIVKIPCWGRTLHLTKDMNNHMVDLFSSKGWVLTFRQKTKHTNSWPHLTHIDKDLHASACQVDSVPWGERMTGCTGCYSTEGSTSGVLVKTRQSPQSWIRGNRPPSPTHPWAVWCVGYFYTLFPVTDSSRVSL